MKKIFLAFAAIFAFSGFVFSQPCNIQLADSGFIFPAPDTFPCIERGVAYSNAIQIKMPAQFHGLVQLDSMVITSVNGLPAGITVAANPSFVFYGDSNGCIAFTGTTSADTGLYNITVDGYAVVSTQQSGTQTLSMAQLAQIGDAPIPGYQLSVINPGDSCHPTLETGITEASIAGLHIYPNPANGIIKIDLSDKIKAGSTIVVSGLTGQTIYTATLENQSTQVLNLTSLSSGIYLLQIKSGANTLTRPEKVIINSIY